MSITSCIEDRWSNSVFYVTSGMEGGGGVKAKDLYIIYYI